GVSYPTALRMFRQIRSLLVQGDGLLSGTVEVDETFIGGKPRGTKPRTPQDAGRARNDKAVVAGAVERRGKVTAKVVANSRTTTLVPFVKTKVLPSSVVYTDDLMSYRTLAREGFQHSRINHSEKVYVSGDVHTQ